MDAINIPVDTKRCISCSTPKLIENDFHRDKSRADGRSSYCKACKKKRDRANYERTAELRRARQKEAYDRCRAVVNRLKNGPCTDCGKSYHPRVMQFDHPDPSTKTANVADLVGSGYLKGLLAEIAKCDLVCSNCHIMRTIRQEELGLIKPGRPRTVA